MAIADSLISHCAPLDRENHAPVVPTSVSSIQSYSTTELISVAADCFELLHYYYDSQHTKTYQEAVTEVSKLVRKSMFLQRFQSFFNMVGNCDYVTTPLTTNQIAEQIVIILIDVGLVRVK